MENIRRMRTTARKNIVCIPSNSNYPLHTKEEKKNGTRHKKSIIILENHIFTCVKKNHSW